MFCFSFSCADLLLGNFIAWITLAKITFLFWIFLCYLLNMSSFCIASISWCYDVVPLFRCSSHVPLFRGIPIVSPVFRCFCSVSVFRQCTAGIPCSGVPGKEIWVSGLSYVWKYHYAKDWFYRPEWENEMSLAVFLIYWLGNDTPVVMNERSTYEIIN